MAALANGGAEPIDFAPMMGAVARRLLGDPNPRLSRGPRLRFGSKGSMEVDTDEGWFDDHEAAVRGGVLELIRHKGRCDTAGAFRWLEEQGLKERSNPLPRSHGPLADAVYQNGASVDRGDERVFYDYCDEDGSVLFRVERRGKDAVPPFLQHGPDGRGGFHSKRGCMQGVPRVPYRLPELLAAAPSAIVFVCEGEKDVDNLVARGLVATTNPGGAGKFTRDLAAPLAGRRVVALEDNDEPGAAHVDSVLKAVDGIAIAAAKLRLPGGPKEDVSDWLKAGGSAHDLLRLAEATLGTAPIGEAFPIVDLLGWVGISPVARRWRMDRFIPEGEVTLFPGPPGVGKSLFAQQLATCHSVGAPMLGIATSEGAALYITAEDDERELHWRQDHICRALHLPLDRLAGKLHLVSLRGRLGNELGTFDNEGRLKPGPTLLLLRATVAATGAKLIVLDNLAHLFAGNENDRSQVTPFVNLLSGLCRDFDTTILLVAHPNKAGDSYSGSTAWLAAVRSQITLARPENAIDPDVRVLGLGKANYARMGEEVTFRWHNFAFITDDQLAPEQRDQIAAAAAAGADNAVFLSCLREREKQGDGRHVGPTPGPNYAPKQFEGMPQAGSIGATRLKKAMERLFTIGAIETVTHRNTAKGRDVTVIREVTLYPRTATPNPSRTVPDPTPDPPPNQTPNHPPHTLPPTGGTSAAFLAASPVPDDQPIPGWDD